MNTKTFILINMNRILVSCVRSSLRLFINILIAESSNTDLRGLDVLNAAMISSLPFHTKLDFSVLHVLKKELSSMHPGKKRNFEILPVIEFLHRICLHIPNPYESLIRYYGYYSNANRGKRKKLSPEIPVQTSIINDAPDRSSCRSSWARLIYQIYEVDPLICPSFGSTMKIISFITDRKHIIKILQHLNLWPVHYPEKTSTDARASPLPFPHFPRNPFSSIT